MVSHMKTTIQLPDSLLKEARTLANKEHTTLKSLMEEGLRRIITEHKRHGEFKLRKATFKGKGAQEFLRYLRSITIEAVGGPQITDAELRHREGMRYLVGIIEQRIDKGKQQ